MSEDIHESGGWHKFRLIDCGVCGRTYDPDFPHICKWFPDGHDIPVASEPKREYDQIIVTESEADWLRKGLISIDGMIVVKDKND